MIWYMLEGHTYSKAKHGRSPGIFIFYKPSRVLLNRLKPPLAMKGKSHIWIVLCLIVYFVFRSYLPYKLFRYQYVISLANQFALICLCFLVNFLLLFKAYLFILWKCLASYNQLWNIFGKVSFSTETN